MEQRLTDNGGGPAVVSYHCNPKELAEWGEEEAKMIRVYKVPTLAVPFPVKINKYLEEVSDVVHSWLVYHKLDVLFGPKLFQEFVKQGTPRLMPYVFPLADWDDLCYVSKFVTFLFCVDVVADETAIGWVSESFLPVFLELSLVLLCFFPDEDFLYESVISMANRHLPAERLAPALKLIEDDLSNARIHRGYKGPAVGALGGALHELMTVSLANAALSKSYGIRLATKMQRYFTSLVHETESREHSTRMITVADYISLRRDTVGVEIIWTLIEFVFKLRSKDEFMTSPVMTRMSNAHTDYVSWHNDLYSFKKEMDVGATLNMVSLISHHQNCSYEEAARETERMMSEKVVEFISATEEAKASWPAPEDQYVICTFEETGKCFMSGTDAWHIESDRYT